MLKFIGSVKITDDVYSFNFEPEPSMTWLPGQFVHISLDHPEPDSRGTERWFTISSIPAEQVITLTTRISSIKPSSFKRAMLLLKPGDEIKTDTPDGDFVLTDLHKNYLFIAGGIGITPFRSIIKALSLENKLPVIKLLYANKTTDIAFKTELEAIERDHNNLNISYVNSPQSIDNILLRNKLGEIIEPDVYISGPESMVDKYLDELLVLGVSKDRIKTDYFPGYESY